MVIPFIDLSSNMNYHIIVLEPQCRYCQYWRPNRLAEKAMWYWICLCLGFVIGWGTCALFAVGKINDYPDFTVGPTLGRETEESAAFSPGAEVGGEEIPAF